MAAGAPSLVYFGVVHWLAFKGWPKEAAVAIIFGLGASLAAWTRVETRSDVLTVILFACLCWINCAAIEMGSPRAPGRWPPIGALAGCVGLAAIAMLHHDRPILGGAEAASAVAFILLDRARCKLSADALRVLADVALLSPVFFLPLAGLPILNCDRIARAYCWLEYLAFGRELERRRFRFLAVPPARGGRSS